MDPVGVSLGAVSLLFQVFAGCIKAYELFSEASDFEKDYQFIRVRFKTEQYRLIDFATVAKLSENDETLLIKASNRDILLQVLDQQSRMMLRFGRLDDRLSPLAHPLLREESADECASRVGGGNKNVKDDLAARFPQNNVLREKALDFIRRTSQYPGRLRWVVFDRSRVEDLLCRLVSLNNFLQDLLTSHQLEQLQLQEVHTSYQIMQLNTKLDQLQELVQAGLLPIGNAGARIVAPLGLSSHLQTMTPVPDPRASALVPKLVQLGQFKAIASTVTNDVISENLRTSVGLTSVSYNNNPLQLRPEDVVLDTRDAADEEASERRVSAWYHPEAGPRRRVWIEWKRIDPEHVHNAGDGPGPDTLRRFRALVALLREHDQVQHFRVPQCLGYYLQAALPTGIRYGLLFQNPPDADPTRQPVSLRELLDDHRPAQPSLTARVCLMRNVCRTLEKLHAVNWLHKGLCSDNIVLFGDLDSEPTSPYLTGFDYSRPSNATSMSSSPMATAKEDLYRHPGVQGGPRDGSHGLGYRKRHDIYSLGVVLLEMAHWQPIESVLGIEDRHKVRVKDVIGARDKLLRPEQLGRLRGAVGNAVSSAIEACLVGPLAFGLTESDSEDDPLVAAKLQMMFYNAVVKPLLETKI